MTMRPRADRMTTPTKNPTAVERKSERVFRLIERYQAWVIVGVRFAYGLRIAGPIIIGTSQISPLKFAIFNAIGALLWAPLIGGIGFLFGEAASAVLGEIQDIELWLLLGLAAAACLYMLLQHLRARSREQPAKDH